MEDGIGVSVGIGSSWWEEGDRIAVEEASVSGPGRDAAVTTPRIRIGIDLGGTKIEGIALDRGGGQLWRRRVETPRDYEMTLDAIVDLVGEAEADLSTSGAVGLGIPGTISPATSSTVFPSVSTG